MDDVAPRLLACLRRTLRAPALDWAEPPFVLAGGYDTAVYAFRVRGDAPPWSAPLVLRVYRPDTQRRDLPRFEAAVHGCLADAGLPVPRVHLVVDGENELGRSFVVMDHAPGRNLVAWLQSPAALRVPRWLGETLAQLHAVNASALERALVAVGVDPATVRLAVDFAEIDRALALGGLDDLRDGADWLARHPPAEAQCVVCHGDFHPLNLLADGKRVTGLIDWPRVRIAEPEYDVAGALALLAMGPMRIPAALEPLARAARQLLARAFLSEYRRRRPADPERLRFYEALRLMRFLVEEGVDLAAERAGRGRSSKRSPWRDVALQGRIAARFATLTGGVRVSL